MNQKPCCAAMELAVKDKYIFFPVSLNAAMEFSVTLPMLEGPKLTATGRKRRPGFFLNLCPWCGHDYRPAPVAPASEQISVQPSGATGAAQPAASEQRADKTS